MEHEEVCSTMTFKRALHLLFQNRCTDQHDRADDEDIIDMVEDFMDMLTSFMVENIEHAIYALSHYLKKKEEGIDHAEAPPCQGLSEAHIFISGNH